jgi:hypothetical protein
VSTRAGAKRLIPDPVRAAVRPARRWLWRRHAHRLDVSPALATPSPYDFLVGPNPLVELGERYQPTKRIHNYLGWYWLHLRDVREDIRTVLEIGVETDSSIRMWEEFFPNATIFGLDVDPACAAYSGGRRRVLIGDQSDPRVLDHVTHEAGGSFDLVIDDGSHLPAHQLATFERLFPRLSTHGVYVVEDTGGVVGDPELRTVWALEQIVRSVMWWPPGAHSDEWGAMLEFDERAGWLDRNAIGIAFYRWIVFVLRGRNPHDARLPQR